MKLQIDPEFQNLIPPLKEEEFKQLRRNIRVDGCIHPIIVWGSVIIDGHNRYKICTEDPNNQIHFDVQQMDFPSREAAMDWIDRNQTGRRNLSPDDFNLIIGRIYNRVKTKGHGVKSGLQKEAQNGKKTSEIIADQFNVSKSRVERAGKLAEAVEEIQKEEPELDRPQVIEKAKQMIKPEPKIKQKEECQEEPKRVIKKEEYQIIKPLGHEVAMKYARMAVLQLESIHRNDHDKDEAFDFVIEWINQHR